MTELGPMNVCPLCEVDYVAAPGLLLAVRVRAGIGRYICRPCLAAIAEHLISALVETVGAAISACVLCNATSSPPPDYMHLVTVARGVRRSLCPFCVAAIGRYLFRRWTEALR